MDKIVAQYIPRVKRDNAIGKGIEKGLVIGLIVGLVGILLGYGIPVVGRAASVRRSYVAMQNAQAQNHLWLMVAGEEPIDHGPLGELAQTFVGLKKHSDPVAALRNHYVQPGAFAGTSTLVGYDIFHHGTDPGSSSSDYTNTEGEFDPITVLNALEANPKDVKDVIVPVPSPHSFGDQRWQWLVASLITYWAIVTILIFAMRSRNHRYEARLEYDFKANLSTVARDALRVYQKIDANRNIPRNDPMRKQAKRLFEKALRGYDDSTAELQREIGQVNEMFEAGQSTYNELAPS